MNEDFVSFELAKKLKEKGFDEPCINAANKFGCTYLNGWCEYLDNRDGEDITLSDLKDGDYLLPTISQVLKWLREKKDIYVQVEYINNKCFGSVIIRRTTGGVIVSYKDDKFHYSDSETLSHEEYEQATLAGIEYVIDNLI